MRPATEDWTAFFHITASANNAELVGQLDHAITDHEYPPTVWAAGEAVQEQSGQAQLCVKREKAAG